MEPGQLLSGLRHVCEVAVGTRSRVGQCSLRNDAHWNLEGQVGFSQAGRTWKEIVGRGRNGEEIGHETFSTRWATRGPCIHVQVTEIYSHALEELRIKFVF